MKNIKKELKGKLSEDQLNKLKKACSDDLAIIRYSLICDFPFTAAISMRMDLIPIRDKRVRTACTDGKSIYWDIDFLSSLKKSEKMFVLAHEIWHACLCHLSRCQTRNKDLFNIASDMEVNQLLIENAAGKNIAPPDGVLFPPNKLKGKSAEVIYDYLLKQAKKQQKQQDKALQSGKGMKSDCADGNSSSTNDDSKDGQSNDKQSSNKNKNGKNTGKLEGQFDKHTYTDDNGDEDVNNKITDQWGEVGYDDDFRPSVPQDIAEKMREAVTAAAQQCQREKGDLPAGVKQLLDKVFVAEIPWYEELAQFATTCYGDTRRWLPPNRRHVYNEMYFQSRRSEKLKCCVCVDTSGSCLGDLSKFFSELIGLVQSFGQYEIHLIEADAAVQKYVVYDDTNQFPIDNIKDIEVSGGGGSDFRPVMKFINDNNIEYDCIVFITDGYIDFPEKAPTKPALIVLTKDGNEDCCSWGKKIRFKESSYSY